MAHRTLVVCPDCVGNRNFCLHQDTCLRPAYDDAALLAAARSVLVLDSDQQAAMRDAGAAIDATALVWTGGPERGSRGYYALTLLGRMLFSGRSARWYQLLVKDRQVASSIHENYKN